MASLAVTNTLSNGATILASEHNTNYSDIVTYINNRNSGSTTWDAVSVLSSSTVPLVVDNSSGTSDIVQLKDNGSNVFTVADGGIVTMGSQSAARAYRGTSNQTFSDSSSESKVEINAETYDVKSEFDSATNYRFTAGVAGKYMVTCSLQVSPGASNTVSTVHIYKNGSSVSQSGLLIPASTVQSLAISDIVTLAATDYIEIYASFNSTGTDTDVVFGETKSWVAIHKIA